MRSMPPYFRCLALLFLLRAANGQERPAQTQPSQAVGEISAALRRGDNVQALFLAQRALQRQPGDCRVLSLQALAFLASSQTDAALQSFQRALKTCPDYLPALEGAAQIEVSRRSAAAVPLLTRALAVDPKNTTAHGMLASALQAENKCEQALPHFVASEALFVRNPGWQQGYAACLALTGDTEGALQQYRYLAATHPDPAYTLDIAMLEWQAHRPAEVLQTLEPLLTARQSEPAFALASRAAEALADTPRAVGLLRTAILLAPDQTDNYVEFANIAFAHTSFQVGIDMLNAGLQRLPSSAPLFLARGILEMQVSREKEALADFERAHRLDPKLSLTDDALGIVQTQHHQSDSALASLQTQVQMHPEDALMQYLLAEQLAQGASDADTQAALIAARRATALEPHYAPAHDLLAKLYLRAQQPKLALEQAQLALKEDPDDQEALYQELMALRRTGDTAGSQALVKKLSAVRKRNLEKQQAIDRYRLVEGGVPSSGVNP